MAKSKFLLSFLVLIACAYIAEAQEDRFVVYFTDKDNTSYSIDAPEEFLSERAIARRISQGIEISINDLPVSSAYLDSLRDNDIAVYHTSKWLNAVLIQTDSATLSTLENASYIDKIDYVAPGAKLKNFSGSSRTSSAKRDASSENDLIHQEEILLEQNSMMGIPEMHDQGYLGQGMLIGVFDGGFLNVNTIEAFEPLFEEERIVATKNFVVNSADVFQYSDHGTRALSVIGGYVPDAFIGTAPEASFILCVTEDVAGEYRIEEYNWLFAAEYADSAGVDVINTSLGYSFFSDASMNYTYADLNGKTAIISRASAIAASKGIVLVASAGNEGDGAWKYISTPADADSILSVGAVFAENYEKVPFSSIGPTADGRIKPEVATLGYGVSTVNKSGQIVPANGTSFASPLVAGLVAGFWQANPSLGNMEVIERIKMSGHRSISPNNQVGHGVPNFVRAMEEIVLGSFQNKANSFRVYPNPIMFSQLNIEVAASPGMEDFEINLYNSAGKVIKHRIVRDHNPSQVINLNFENILPGVYIMNIVSGKTSEAVKIIKF